MVGARQGTVDPHSSRAAHATHLSLPWLAALPNVAAAALTMLCPVRLAMAASSFPENLKTDFFKYGLMSFSKLNASFF
jgi:hypothetical protein